MIYTQQFIRAVNFLLDPTIEGAGKLSLDPTDDGNWTGGAKGKGELKGTKWGISAAQYPALDINSLSREQAVAIYNRDYWNAIQGDRLPQRLAIVVFDSAVNQGLETAIKLLQSAVGAQVDGAMGPQTIGAVNAMDQDKAINYTLAARAVRYPQAKNWPRDGKGWMRRMFSLCSEVSR